MKITKLKNNTYLEGKFKVYNKESNTAGIIDFPTVFRAFGKAIRSGNWQSCTAINTPEYIAKYIEDDYKTNKSLYDYKFKVSEMTIIGIMTVCLTAVFIVPKN